MQTYYTTVVEEYFASSYGDPLFAILVLLPTMTANSGREALVQHLWRDCAENLSALRLSPSDLPAPLSVESFVSPAESEDVVDALVRAVAGGRVDPDRNPLLFLIAARGISSSPQRNYKVLEKHRDILAEKGVML